MNSIKNVTLEEVMHEIWGFHSGGNSRYVFLGYDSMQA
jgi:hypothetical protein